MEQLIVDVDLVPWEMRQVKKEAVDHIVKTFCDKHNISVEDLEQNLKVTVAQAHAPFLLFAECVGAKQFSERRNGLGGFIINMVHRASNTFGSMIVLMVTGHLQDAEINSRTLSESALTIQYLLTGDVLDNLSNYLASYYPGQKNKNDKWGNVDSNPDREYHSQLISDKNETEGKAKDICKSFIEAVGGRWPKNPKPASMHKIYETLGREVEYRTVYRAMCGQSHQNPEDLINSFLASFSVDIETESMMYSGKHAFSIFMCLWATRYYLEALEMIGKYYGFSSVIEQSNKSLSALKIMHYNISGALEKCIVPKYWVKSVIHGI